MIGAIETSAWRMGFPRQRGRASVSMTRPVTDSLPESRGSVPDWLPQNRSARAVETPTSHHGRSRFITSLRVPRFSRKIPRTADVMTELPDFFTPRIVMQVCVASRNDDGRPRGSAIFVIRSAIWFVRRSCT